jgi:PIN domain nuclease of toxin-antitoxin system
MRLLLDSHIAFWALGNPNQLNQACQELLQDGRNDVFVSSASIWELRLKSEKGKLKIPNHFEQALRETGFSELTVKWSHAVKASQLPKIHQDPFDRVLIAQSILEDLVLVTRDANIQNYGTATFPG